VKLIVLALAWTLLVGIGSASAALGDLTYQDCITGETQSGPGGSGACAQIGTAAPGASDSGLQTLEDVAVSPDGESVYVAARNDHAIAQFDRDPATGAIAYQGCITGEIESGPSSGGGSGACTAIASATSMAQSSGFEEPRSPVVSPDGESLYVSSSDDSAIARFDRDPATGALTHQGCITGKATIGPTGSNACAQQIPSATPTGANSGLHGAFDLAISADGSSLYAAAHADTAIARFARDIDTGALTYQNCVTGETETGPPAGGTGACSAIGSAAPGGVDSGLDFPMSLALSADDGSLYVVSSGDDAVARFDRGTPGGSLNYRGCISGEIESGTTGAGGSGACAEIESASSTGASSGLDSPNSLALSPDGTSLYLAASGDDAVAEFARAPAGTLSYRGCITGMAENAPVCVTVASASTGGANSGLDLPNSLVASPDGQSLYASAQFDDAVASFDRDAGTGALTYGGCLTGETQTGAAGTGACTQIPSAASGGTNSGLGSPSGLAMSPDGRSLYVTTMSDGLARFDRELATGAAGTPGEPPSGGAAPGDTDPPETQITRGPKKKTQKKKAKFEFSADEQGSSFECKLDEGPFEQCSSPLKRKVKPGKHVLEVQATDAAGNTDPTPARHKWKRKRKP
jgi:sugar lactone lactonase YvrE